jgi:FlaA1/EpsC-like NDP-sugar epimerase
MLFQFRNYRFYILLAADALVFVMALVGAYLLRFDFYLSTYYKAQIMLLLLFFLPVKLLIFFLFSLYGGMWRYTSLIDLVKLSNASLLSTLANIIIIFSIYGFEGFPRSIFLLDCILTFVMGSSLRVGVRFFYIFRQDSKNNYQSIYQKSRPQEKSILIVGAGRAGEFTIDEILGNPQVNCLVAGFLDDDRTKWGRSLHGLKVYGGVERLPEVLKQTQIDEVLIAIPSATGAQIKRIVGICKECNVPFRTLPEMGAIIDGKVSISKFREIRYEDLLRRTPVNLDTPEINKYLQGKRVLVTGAGGSIGSELCRQMVPFGLERLILLDASEPNLFNIQMEMEQELNFKNYQSILTQVQNRQLMNTIFAAYRPHVIFHAAACKHVPLVEKNPWEAIFNNVLGSQVAMELSLKYGVERFVLVSTDKAVRPTNVMGASKRLTELILQSLDGNGTLFAAVRFGNVAGSSGSVLPIFRRQLEKGGPITVTHPEMTRYFMTIPEAAQLILQAGALGESGKIFMLEMGSPIRILDMAKELVRLSGREAEGEIEIIFTGLRDGEKLCEELIYQGENIINTKYEKILVLQSEEKWKSTKSKEEFKKQLDSALVELYQIATSYDALAIKSKLCEIIPEYIPQLNAQCVLPCSEKQLYDQVSEAAFNETLSNHKKLGEITSKRNLKRANRRRGNSALARASRA